MNNKLPKAISAAIMTAALLSSSLTAASFQTFADFHVQKTVYVSSTAASQSSGFYVDGTTIRDANGNAFVMRGVNIAHAWYKDQTETSIKAAASLGTNVVRIVCADGVQWEKTSADELKNIIKICRENNQVCILEVHDATGRDSTDDLLKAVDYWIEMKEILDENQKYVILNIVNEWFGTWDGSAWAEGCKTAVKKVRDAGIRNMIMIDCAGWGQYPDSVKDYGKSVFQADPDKNTVFSVHMYEYAGGNAEMVKNNIDNTLGIGVPVVIGEFGGQHTDGDVDEATIMQYCTEKGAGYLGWSWKGNNSDLAFLDIAESWDGSSLTEWGKALIYGDYGIQKTSEICSVFGSKPEQTTEASEAETTEKQEETTETNLPSSENFGFYVDGTTIRDANGNAFVMRGVNIAHAWYKDQTETSIKAAASLGTNVVRIVCADGVQWEKTSADELKNIIKICRENNQVCILEVHDATGRDSTDDLLKAVDYWIEMKEILDENQKYVILNIANEWFGTWDGSAWAEGCKTAVKKVRDAGIRNMIMIDCAGWGQYPDSVKDYGKSVFQADPDKNTVFSVHMYEYAGGNAEMVKNNIDNTLGIGVPVVIGEFGGQHTDGDVDEATIMQYCTEKGAGYLGWSWKGNNSDLAFLDIAENWDGSSLTEWGKALIYGDYGIQKTSKICSVFGADSEQMPETTEEVQESTEETTEKDTTQKYQISANSSDEIQVVLKGTPNASANGCFGYKDNSGEWIADEWSATFDSDGKAVVNYTVPADANSLEFQIWWAGLWNDSTQSNDDADAEVDDYTVKSAVSETAETEAESVHYGDVNEDGKIDILDVITLNRAILGKENLSVQAGKNADVNQNGSPDSTDSLMIMKYIVGLITDFSV